VYAHVANRPEKVIGVLDTYHSQGGWAVARACKLLHKTCVEFYPVRKAEPGWFGPVQKECADLGAITRPLQAGRSAVLYHAAKAYLAKSPNSYMMPNALKLPEMITETVAEVWRTSVPGGWPETVIVSASSGTIAAGVLKGLTEVGWPRPGVRGNFIVHQGYSRTAQRVADYMGKMIGWDGERVRASVSFVDEGYAYGDEARGDTLPPFPCNVFYDLKAFRWWVREGRAKYGEALLWNIG